MPHVEFTANVRHNGVAYKAGDVVELDDVAQLVDAGLAKTVAQPVQGGGQTPAAPLAPGADTSEPDGFPQKTEQPPTPPDEPTPAQVRRDFASIDGLETPPAPRAPQQLN